MSPGRSYYDLIQSFGSEEEEIKKCKLTGREIEIVRMIADRSSSSQIANRLFISEHTVKTHRKNILKKLAVGNSSELIQYALNIGIL